MGIQNKINHKVFYILMLLGVVILSVFVVLPLLHQGFFPMHDDTQIGRIGQMTKALLDGQFPVRWVRDLGFGYGYPIYNFYAPLPFYMGSLFQLMGFNVLDATKLTFGFALLFSAVTMFIFANEFFGTVAGIVSAIIYVYFPYHAVDTYVRGNLDELLAYAFLPLVFLAFYKLFNYARGIQVSFPIRLVLLLAVSVSLVTLSHNLSAFMIGIIFVPLGIASIFFVPRKSTYILWLASAAVLSVALSAFYIIPAVSEMHFSNVLSQVGGGSYYADHFVCPSQLLNSPWGFGGSVKGCVDGMSFKLGKDNILFLILALLIFAVSWLRKDYTDSFIKLSFVALLGYSLWLILPWSLVLWKVVPFMAFLQFPWRFLIFVGFSLSAIVGMGVFVANKTFHVPRSLLLVVAAFLVAGTVWYNARLFTPQSYNVQPIGYYSSPEYLKWYVSKQSSEYLPKNFQHISSGKMIATQPVSVVSGNVQLQTVKHTSTNLAVKFNALQSSVIHFNLAYYPNWKYILDSQHVPITIQKNGVSVAVPVGEHTLSAQYSQTTVEKIADGVSIIALLVVLILLIRVQYRRSL